MKILHTADLHLNESNPERWAALEELVTLARRQQVSALVIAGDLFDREIEAESMRGRLRTVIGGGDFQTIILPGNHDYKAYRSGLYFGEKVTVINDWKKPVFLGDTVIWGLPYEPLGKEQLAGRLREMKAGMSPEVFNILLFHGELLDTCFSRQDLGAEGDLRYMPVRLSYFEPLPLHYVLAGHFHSRFATWQLPGGGLFVYPGSPVAVTRKEAGIRKANLLVPGQDPQEVVLDSFHYEEIEVILDPFSKHHPLAGLDQALAGLHPAAGVQLTVEGLFNGSAWGIDETELAALIRQKTEPLWAAEPVYNFLDVRHVLEDELFKKFATALEERGCGPETKARVREMVIHAFRGVKSCS